MEGKRRIIAISNFALNGWKLLLYRYGIHLHMTEVAMPLWEWLTIDAVGSEIQSPSVSYFYVSNHLRCKTIVEFSLNMTLIKNSISASLEN